MRILILANPHKAAKLRQRLISAGAEITLANNSARLILLLRQAEPGYDMALLEESLTPPNLLRSIKQIHPDLPVAFLPGRRQKRNGIEVPLTTIYHRDPQAE